MSNDTTTENGERQTPSPAAQMEQHAKSLKELLKEYEGKELSDEDRAYIEELRTELGKLTIKADNHALEVASDIVVDGKTGLVDRIEKPHEQ